MAARVRELLLARIPVRADPGRRAAFAVGAAVLIAALVTGAWLLAARPRAVAVAPSPAALPSFATPVGSASPPGSAPAPTAPPSPAPVPATTSAGLVVVDVAGKVRRPGLYRLAAGARVADALHAAGGALRGVNLISLDLAARLVDGEQIAVGARGAASGGGDPGAVGNGAGGSDGATSSPGGGPVDLNTATLEQLEALPGVGPVLGQHILDWRTQHGSFTALDQLQDVSGIGPAKYAALQGQVTL